MPPAIPTVGIVQILTIKMFLVKCLWHVVHAVIPAKLKAAVGYMFQGTHLSKSIRTASYARLKQMFFFYFFLFFFILNFFYYYFFLMKILMQRMHKGW